MTWARIWCSSMAGSAANQSASGACSRARDSAARPGQDHRAAAGARNVQADGSATALGMAADPVAVHGCSDQVLRRGGSMPRTTGTIIASQTTPRAGVDPD